MTGQACHATKDFIALQDEFYHYGYFCATGCCSLTGGSVVYRKGKDTVAVCHLICCNSFLFFFLLW